MEVEKNQPKNLTKLELPKN